MGDYGYLDGEGDGFMRNRITFKKLKCQRGETLVEVLVAILISSLGMLMLAMSISSTISIVTSSKTVMNDYYANQTALVEKNAGGIDNDVTEGALQGEQKIEAQISTGPNSTTSVPTKGFAVSVYEYPCGNQTIRLYDSWSSS